MVTGDFLGDLFGVGQPKASPKPAAEVLEKGVQLRGREIDGNFYLRAEDVVGLLEVNKVLPKATRLIKGKLRK